MQEIIQTISGASRPLIVNGNSADLVFFVRVFLVYRASRREKKKEKSSTPNCYVSNISVVHVSEQIRGGIIC